MAIIGLAGKIGSGKDSVGKILVEQHGYTRVAFANALKALAFDLNPIIHDHNDGLSPTRLQDFVYAYGWEAAKREHAEVRRTLQALGVAARDNLYSDVWLDVVVDQFDDENNPNVVVTDVRFPNEAQAVLHAGGTVYRVVRPGFDGDGHTTETALDKYEFPTIDNSGSLEDLADIVAGIAV